MRVSKVVLLALCAALLLSSAALAEDTVKIGLLVPLTGPAAADGASALASVQIALDQVNADGGVLGKQVELIYYDDRADTKDAVALAHKLIEQDKIVAFVAGSYSLPTRSVAPIFQEEEIPLVAAYAIHPDVTRAGDYCFRNGFLGFVEGKAAGYASHKLLGAKRVALLTSDNDFGTTLVTGFKMYKDKYAPEMEIVSEQTYPMSETDYKPYLSKIKEINPDVIFASGYYFQTGPMLRQARELYQREVERESERMNERVNELRRKLESAAEDVRPALQKQLDEWTARAESARQTLERLKGASDEAWREMRKGVDNALQEYQEALEQPAPDAPPTTAPGK